MKWTPVSLFILTVSVCLATLAQSEDALSKNNMTFKKLIVEGKNESLDKMLPKVGKLMFSSSFLIPFHGEIKGTKGGGQVVPFLLAKDKNGEEWIYLYTDEAELLKSIPGGSQYVEMGFADIFALAKSDPKYGGVAINYAFFLPRELFAKAEQYKGK